MFAEMKQDPKEAAVEQFWRGLIEQNAETLAFGETVYFTEVPAELDMDIVSQISSHLYTLGITIDVKNGRYTMNYHAFKREPSPGSYTYPIYEKSLEMRAMLRQYADDFVRDNIVWMRKGKSALFPKKYDGSTFNEHQITQLIVYLKEGLLLAERGVLYGEEGIVVGVPYAFWRP